MSMTPKLGRITIKYLGGKTIEGVVLALYGTMMRVAVQGSDDTVQFTFIHGTWASEDFGPVEIQFASQGPASEEDGICPNVLAEKLVQILRRDDCDNMLPMLPVPVGLSGRPQLVSSLN